MSTIFFEVFGILGVVLLMLSLTHITPVASTQVHALSSNPYSVASVEIDGTLDDRGNLQLSEQYVVGFEADTKTIDLDIRPQGLAKLRNLMLVVERSYNQSQDAITEEAVVTGSDYGRVKAKSTVTNVESQQILNDSGRPLLTYTLAPPAPHWQRLQLQGVFKKGTMAKITVSYDLEDAILRSETKSFLHLNLKTLAVNKDLARIDFFLTMPNSIESNEFEVISGTLSDVSTTQESPTRIMCQALSVTANDTAEIVLALPTRVSPLAVSNSQLNTETTYIYEMQKKQTTLRHNYYKLPLLRIIIVVIALVLFVLLICGIVIVQRRLLGAITGKRRLPMVALQMYPGLCGGLWRKKLQPESFFATMLDLVRRGELSLDGQVFSLVHATLEDYTGLAPFEVFLLQWLTDDLSKTKKDFVPADFVNYFNAKQGKFKFSLTLNHFRQLVLAQLEENGAVNHQRMKRVRAVLLIIATAIFVFMTVLLALGEIIGLALIVPLVGYAIASWQASDMTFKGRKLAEMLYRFKFWLRRIERTKNIKADDDIFAVSDSSLERHIVELLPLAIGVNEFETFFALLERLPDSVSYKAKRELLRVYRFGGIIPANMASTLEDRVSVDVLTTEMISDLRIFLQTLRRLFCRYDRERRTLFGKV